MKKYTIVLQVLVVLGILLALFTASPAVQASTPDPLIGNWFINWSIPWVGIGTAGFEIFWDGSSYSATVYIPALGVFYEPWPVFVFGNSIYIGILEGTITNGVITGDQDFPVPGSPVPLHGTWEAFNISQEINVSIGPEPTCEDLPKLLCTGSAEYCSELVTFDPRIGVGYADYPENGETWENQYRSYLRRDLMQLISYATAKLQCKTADWEFGSGSQLGLVDMSEADGAIPGSSIGYPGHPSGTHTNGKDIDVAYYQFYTPDNRPRTICDTYEGINDALHCTSQPYLLDPWRTTLFAAYLAEHPNLRVMGVDGKVGPKLEDSLDWFIENGWVDPADFHAPLVYEETDQGWGFFQFHHHHMHISMNPVEPILLDLQVEPETVNLRSTGKYLTAYIELKEGFDPGLIDTNTVFITVDGYSTIPADLKFGKVGDYDSDGFPDLMVKFDCQSVQSLLSAGWVEITLYGVMDGIFFQGADTILVK